MKPHPKSTHALAVFAALTACWACSAPPNDDGAAAHNVSMIQAYVDASTRGDPSYLDEYFGPGYVYHGPGGDMDAEAFRAFHGSVLAAFPGATMSAVAIVPSGDSMTTTRWQVQGTHAGPFLGIPATGREVTITGIIISRFENGKVVEEWEEANLLGLMQQLGVVTPPGGG